MLAQFWRREVRSAGFKQEADRAVQVQAAFVIGADKASAGGVWMGQCFGVIEYGGDAASQSQSMHPVVQGRFGENRYQRVRQFSLYLRVGVECDR